MSKPIFSTTTAHPSSAGSSQSFGLSGQLIGNSDVLLNPRQIERSMGASSDRPASSLQQRDIANLSPIRAFPNPAAFCLNLDSWRTIQANVLEREVKIHGQVLDRILLDDHILMLAVLENNDLKIESWDLNTGKIITRFNVHGATARIILIDKNHILYPRGSQLYLLDTWTNQASIILEMGGPITWVIQLKNGNIAAAINGTSIEVWDFSSRRRLSRFDIVNPSEISQLQASLNQSRIDCQTAENQSEVSRISRNAAETRLENYERNPDRIFGDCRDWKLVEHQENLKRAKKDAETRSLAEQQARMTLRHYQTALLSRCIYFIKELPDGNLCVALGDQTKRYKFNLEGQHLAMAEAFDPNLVCPEFFSNDLLTSFDGKRIAINQVPFNPTALNPTMRDASILTFQSKAKSLKEKLLALLSMSPERTIAFSSDLIPVLTLGEMDELLTVCEENTIVTGILLPERPSSPLLSTRAYHLCPRPRLTQSEKALVKVSDEFLCSITREIMLDPVIAADGESYERAAMKGWLAQNQTSPKHHTPLEHSQLTPNRNLQRSIDAFLQEHPFLFEPDNGTEHSVYTAGMLKEAKDLFARKESNPLQRLIERHPQLMALPFEDGQTLVHLACSQPSDELLKAVLRGLGKYIVPILMRHSVETFFRMAVKAMGAEGGRIIAKATFWKESDYLQECRAAIQRGDLETVDACLQLGVSVDAVLDPQSGNGLLHEAVAANQQQIAEFLVNYGSDVKLKNGQGQTPEELAYTLGHQHLVKAIYDTYLRKISVPQIVQTTPTADRSAVLEAQNRQLAEQVTALQRQMAELMEQQKEKGGLSVESLTVQSSQLNVKK